MVFENRALVKMHGYETITNRSMMKMRSDQLHNLDSPPNTIRVFKSMTKWVDNVACTETMINMNKIAVVKSMSR
jgi:hypothetical protein